jgi:NAD(P)-dependent dehydrogenase (short-subunit alcohol dehydrogenase family)
MRKKANERLKIIEEAGGKGYFALADASDRQSLNELLNSVVEQSGKVDILVNGAGINSPSPFVEITDDEALKILDVNLGGCHARLPSLWKLLSEPRCAGLDH